MNDLPPDQSGAGALLSDGHQRIMGVILMACKNDFERYLECKGDEIDNAAYALAVALLRTHPDQTDEEVLPWDMAIIAPIIESAQEELERSGKQTCWPYLL